MKLVRSILAALMMCVSAAAMSQQWPERPVKFIVPWPPGGINDVIARAFNEAVSKELGQTVVIDFKPGAAGRIGVAEIARSRPDGYTIGMGNLGPLTIFPSLYKEMPFDVGRDLIPICMFAASPLVLVVPGDSQVQTAQDLVAELRAKPGKTNFASVGLGSPAHLTFEMLKAKNGLQAVHVPYKGTSQTILGLLSGDVHSMFDTLPSLMPFIKSGKMRPLAVTTAQRVPQLPDVPTLKELGLSDVEVVTWYALIAPAQTPQPIVDRLYAEYDKAAKTPEIVRLLDSSGLIYIPNTPAQFNARIVEETARWAGLIRDNKIEVEQ